MPPEKEFDLLMQRVGVVGRVGLLGAVVVVLTAGVGVRLDAPAVSGPVAAVAQGGAGDAKEGSKDAALTLERIFPEKSFFGPSARGMAFSHDGRLAAFLYRPFAERRHGNDLYILDTDTGQARRITSVGRMAEFQADAREVRDDREKKAKRAGVSLRLLGREQLGSLGWTQGRVVGAWAGDARAEGDGAEGELLRAGGAELDLTERANGSYTGELRVGFVRLALQSVKVDEGRGTAEAKVDDTALGIKGGLSLRLEDGELRGELTLTDPEQTLALSLARKEGEGDVEPEHTPGVVGAWGERLTLGDVVLDDDAEINDDKDGEPVKVRAPRYGGVSSFEWAPNADELLLVSGGDLYRLTIDREAWDKGLEGPAPVDAAGEDGAESGDAEGDEDASEGAGSEEEGDAGADGAEAEEVRGGDAPELAPVAPYRGELSRQTRTRESMSDVQYLPDGSGYTYLRGGALLRVSFGDHLIVQLDPALKDGERMVGYRISPDMRRLVFLATRGETTGTRARQVTIVNYRDRFAVARQVARHMPDDPWPESYTSVYLYDLRGHDREDGKLERVFSRRVSGPRDVMQVPEWSPDSSRIAFAAFDQQAEDMKILEAGFVTEKKEEEEEAEPEPTASAAVSSDDGQGDDQDDEQDDQQEEQQDGEREEERDTGRGTDRDGDDDKEPAKEEEEKEAEELEFKIENARVVYRFLHAGGPNTPRMVRPMYLPDSRRMVFITEISGYRHLHLLEPRYEQLTQVTKGPFEVYPFHLSDDHTTLFATANEGDPAQEHVYKIDLERIEVTRLTDRPGVYQGVAVRDDGSMLLALHADFGSPRELVAVRPGAGDEGEAWVRLTGSHPEEAHKLTAAAPEYFSFENRHGQVIHGHMFKPSDWTAEDRRPLLIYVYGGPLSANNNMIARGSFSAPGYFFARYMAEKHGFVTATIDPRGASGFGAVFEKANFERVGKPQTEDLVDGAKWFVRHHGVDEKRMALHGWSFGGFQTQMVMYTEPDVFAVGIAGAGPTEWHNYNSWYSTGTIGANRPGRTDLEEFSLLPLAKNLKGKLMLVHGVEDSNVLYQDTVRVYRELLKADKEVHVELFIDPTGGHGLGGDVKTIGRYRKYEDFLVRNLGTGEPAKRAADETQEPEAAEADDALKSPPDGDDVVEGGE